MAPRAAILVILLGACGSADNGDNPSGDAGPGPDDPDGSRAGDPDAGPITPTIAPNIVLVLTDDQDFRSFEKMPIVQARIADQGVALRNYVATYAVCAPSRASILTGAYPHNHGVMGNYALGGYKKFRNHEGSTLATWLRAGGYRTALFGKYLNGYGTGAGALHVPTGWDDWHGFAGPGYYGYDMIEKIDDGAAVKHHFGNDPSDYSTNVLSKKAVAFIERQETDDARPFFMYVAPSAPHGPSTPGPGDGGLFAGVKYPRGAAKNPAFDEADVSDKPAWIRNLPRISAARTADIDAHNRERLRTLAAVDAMVGEILDALDAASELDNTIVVFTSDHGFHQGEHRQVSGKRSAYEQDVRTPLYVRGPGVAVGATREHLIANIDLAPTFADLAGITIPEVDGSSFKSVLGGAPPALASWDHDYLLVNRAEPQEPYDTPDLDGLRNASHKFIAVASQIRELYDLEADPFELRNVRDDQAAIAAAMRARVEALKTCAGASCR